jgi:hypothetical protein
MADDREWSTEGLASAAAVDAEPATVTPPSRSEQVFRWINAFVLIMLLAAAGGWYWQNRASVTSHAKRFRQRTSNPFDFVLWLGGSKHTFEESLLEAHRKSAAEFDDMEPACLDTEFDHVDFEKLWSQPGQP